MRPGISFDKLWNVITDAPLSVLETSVVPPASKVEGLKIEYLKGWIQIAARNGNRIYIARCATVRDIALSGFGKDFPGTNPPPRKNGAVEAHLDLTDEAKALASFSELVSSLASLAPTPKAPRLAPMASSSPKVAKPLRPDPKSANLASLDQVAAQERLNRLLAYAQTSGVKVNEETIASLIVLGAVLPESTT